VLQAFGQTSVTHAIAAFAGLMAFPLAIPTHDADTAPAVKDTGESAPATDVPTPSCLATTICEVKDRVRWRTSAWKPAFCERIANAVLDSSKRYAVPASLILAVMVNESDMNENAFRATMKDAHLYAKDGGLMGIRCIVDKQSHCTNGNVRGMAWSEVMDPVTNIHLGARELAHWKNGGGITNVTVRSRGRDGKVHTIEKHVPCTHKTHAYWAHYNHGPRYIDHGPARHYPHRIAVLYYALSRVMKMNTSALTLMRLTVNDPGKRPRTADRPVEARYRKLCEAIRDVGPVCSDRSTAQLNAGPAN
jgi:hypothetical protein